MPLLVEIAANRFAIKVSFLLKNIQFYCNCVSGRVPLSNVWGEPNARGLCSPPTIHLETDQSGSNR